MTFRVTFSRQAADGNPAFASLEPARFGAFSLIVPLFPNPAFPPSECLPIVRKGGFHASKHLIHELQSLVFPLLCHMEVCRARNVDTRVP